jgi:hypothetical protein
VLEPLLGDMTAWVKPVLTKLSRFVNPIGLLQQPCRMPQRDRVAGFGGTQVQGDRFINAIAVL